MKTRKSFPLRIDPLLYAELERWSQQEFRSVNAQIEYILREAVKRRTGKPDPSQPPADSPPNEA